MRLKLLTLLLSVIILPAMSWAASAPDISGQALCSASITAGDYFENNRITWTMPVAPPAGTRYIVSYKNAAVTTWTQLSNNATSPYTPPRPTSAYTYYQVSSVDGATPTVITPSKTIIIYRPARAAEPYCGNASNPTFPAIPVDDNGNLNIGLMLQEDGVAKSVAILPPTQSSNLKVQRYDLTFSVSLVDTSVAGLRTRFQVAGAEKRLGAFNSTSTCSLSCASECSDPLTAMVQHQKPNAACTACVTDGPAVASTVDTVVNANACTGGTCGGQTCAANTHCRTTSYSPLVCPSKYECIPDTGCGGAPTCDSRPTCYGSYTDADGPHGADTGFRMACCNGKVTSFTDKGGNIPACPATTSNSIACDWTGAKTFAGEPQETPRSRMTITCANSAVTALDVTGQPANFTTTTFNWNDDGDGNDLIFRKNTNTPLGFDGIGYHGLNGDVAAPGWSGCCSAAPANTTMCDNDGSSTNTTSTVVTACSTTNTCEFTCNTGYARSGASSCTAIIYQCFGTPANATACPGDTGNLTANATSRVVTTCNDATKCEFTCNNGFEKVGLTCSPVQTQCEAYVLSEQKNTGINAGATLSYSSPSFPSDMLLTVEVSTDDLVFDMSFRSAQGNLDQNCNDWWSLIGPDRDSILDSDNGPVESCGKDNDSALDTYKVTYRSRQVSLNVTEAGNAGSGDPNTGYKVTAQQVCVPPNGGIVAARLYKDFQGNTSERDQDYVTSDGTMCSVASGTTVFASRAAALTHMQNALSSCCVAKNKVLRFNSTPMGPVDACAVMPRGAAITTQYLYKYSCEDN